MSGRIYDTRRWKRVKARQLAREPFCRACASDGIETLAQEVDHVLPVEQGGAPFATDNLQSLCSTHHSIKTGAFDKQGKSWTEWEYRGCFPDGSPRDPEHPWYRGGSINGVERANTDAPTSKQG